MTTADTEQTAQRELLNEQRKVLSRFFSTPPEVSSTTPDAAFTAAKRGECGAIYASRSDLWEDIKGFRRDNIRYSVIPLWFEPKQVADRADEIRSEEEKALKAEQDLKRKREEEAELAKLHEQTHAKEKAAQEAELRAKYGPQARAEANQITSALNDLVEGKDSWAKSQFPNLAKWYGNRRTEGWEFVSQDNQITDYGTVDWKGRPLDAVFTDDSISMKNRLLGENKTFCFSLGLIFDSEFEMYREPFEAPCENASELSKAWKHARSFQSRWVAEGEAFLGQ